MSLLHSLMRLARLQQEGVDRLALQDAATVAEREHAGDARAQLGQLIAHLQLPAPRWMKAPDASAVPALVYRAPVSVKTPARTVAPEAANDAEPPPFEPSGWGVLRGTDAQGRWVSEWWDAAANQWREQADARPDYGLIAKLRLRSPFQVGSSPAFALIKQELFNSTGLIRDVAVGGLMVNVIALATSFYSMQVYDRVMPTGATQTLLVLTIGVLGAMLFEYIAKRLRTGLCERLIDQIDQRLARQIYMRFLSIRLDQLPQSVGGMAGQLRGYETVRSFFTTITSNLLVDAPFAVFFTIVVAAIAGPLALVPLLFLVMSLVLGFSQYRRLDGLARTATVASNQKIGLLVETVEGAETIKAGQGGWRMLSRWIDTTDQARDSELKMRSISEHAQHLSASFQQLSYVLMVATGALLVSRGELTMGALIACSILSGRILTPVGMIPNLMVQWAHTRAALAGLDQLWRLQDDHHGQAQPVVVNQLHGRYRLEGVVAQYKDHKALSVPQLQIGAGEKIGVLGPIGSGKTTLLRLLSGMYKPQEGRVMLDDIDLAHLSKAVLAEQLGFVQQEGRLFAGTLRDNLILGQIDPGDEVILDMARRTGLLQTVISQRPKGLQQDIFEGGAGLSGGQRQLVNLTRAFLLEPRIWLLDEPTASMDRGLELQVTQALRASIRPQDTLVLVTHKIEMLEIVDRLIVIANHQVVMDGPKAEVLARLGGAPATNVPALRERAA